MNENVYGIDLNVLGKIDWMCMDWMFENCMGIGCLIWMDTIGQWMNEMFWLKKSWLCIEYVLWKMFGCIWKVNLNVESIWNWNLV